jgi:hypothetical protein
MADSEDLKKKPTTDDTSTTEGSRSTNKSKVTTDTESTQTNTGGELIDSPLPPRKER